uniref:Uncharacterized protein n=1 Tax=viral metagenome TaxID=1070528 RepID=A0A6C0EFI9_9ZZZZ
MLPSNKNNNSELCIDSHDNTIRDNYIHKVEDVNNLLESSFENISQNIISNPELDNDNDKSYYYQAIECLNSDINTVYNNCLDGARIHLCMYNVNTNAKHPFLEFYLIKNRHDDFYPDILCFPSFFYYNEMNIDISTESLKIFKMLFIDVANIKFNGYLLEETNNLSDLYLFYEYKNVFEETPTPTTDNAIGNGEMYRNDILWKVVIDEIVNSRLVCNFPINDIVTYFFLRNPQFMFLYKYNNNENNIIYETPTAVYHGVNESMLYFKYIFGIPKTNYDDIMGPFYYFTNYKNAVKMSIDSYNNKYNNTPNSDGDTTTNSSQPTSPNVLSNILGGTFMNTDKKIGIIRSVIFLGVNKVPMNYPEDEVDESYHSSILSCIDNENAQINRITDHNGSWTEKYDSVYVGKLLLDNGKFISGTPMWVVKDYNQQASLSYHYLSSTLLKDEWSDNIDYYIL